MIEHVGAKQINAVNPIAKRDLLIFDAVIVPDLPGAIGQFAASDAAALEWLEGEGCIRSLGPTEFMAMTKAAGRAGSFLMGKAALGTFLLQIGMVMERYRSLVGDGENDHQWVAVLGHENHVDYTAQLVASFYKNHPTIRVAPLLRNFSGLAPFRIEGNANSLLNFLINSRSEYDQAVRSLHLDQDQHNSCYDSAVWVLKHLMERTQDGSQIGATQTEVLQIVLEEFPLPDESVSWEQILDYRRDPDSQARLQWLRAWMKRLAEGDLGEREIHDEYQELLFAFRDHMRIHRMKVQAGGIQALWTLPATVLENVLRLRFTKVGEALFWTKYRHVELLETERAAPGREIAYVVSTQQKFGK